VPGVLLALLAAKEGHEHLVARDIVDEQRVDQLDVDGARLLVEPRHVVREEAHPDRLEHRVLGLVPPLAQPVEEGGADEQPAQRHLALHVGHLGQRGHERRVARVLHRELLRDLHQHLGVQDGGLAVGHEARDVLDEVLHLVPDALDEAPVARAVVLSSQRPADALHLVPARVHVR